MPITVKFLILCLENLINVLNVLIFLQQLKKKKQSYNFLTQIVEV